MTPNSRSYITHFVQADDISIKVGSIEALDRFSYVSNNPINRADPTGHQQVCHDETESGHTFQVCSEAPDFYKGLTRDQLLAYWQGQGNDSSGCGPFSLAMAANLYRGQNLFTGSVVEDDLQALGFKISGAGIPSSMFGDPVRDFNSNASVTVSANNTIADLKAALAANKLPIVAVSWETNADIAADIVNGTTPSVGHYMVAVGSDKNNVYLLDPGANSSADPNALHAYSNQDFGKIWNDTSNFFIAPGSMYTIQ